MTSKEKFDSLNSKSAWAYTKQKANFKDVYNSAKLFSEIPDIENTKVEKYFAEHYEDYGISTNRHRILAIAQMFGLITKDSYYSRGKTNYSKEMVTPVFELLKKLPFGSVEFNKVISEQLIKIKAKSIIDTASHRDNFNIYPFLFLFLVMWKLDVEHGIKSVSVDKLWTYVFTCNSMNDLNEAVKWMIDPKAKISPFINQYKSDSRFMTIFLESTRMFSLDKKMLSLNHPIAENFFNNCVLRQDLGIININLYNDAKYKKYLENYQGFDFDLTDNSSGVVKHIKAPKQPIFRKKTDIDLSGSKDVSIVIPDKGTKDVDDIIDRLIDLEEEQEVKEAKVYDTEEEIQKSNNRKPEIRNGLESNHRYTTDPRLAKTAIKKSGYVCELSGKISGSHLTFDSTHGTKYLEAHHLIPMKAQHDFVSLGINLDRLENIVALCPNCHKAVHYGTKEEKIKYLKPLYEDRKEKLKKVGIDIDFDILIEEYY